MGYAARNWVRLAYWNLWPALRLILVLAALAAWAHRSFGIDPPSLRWWGEVAGCLGVLLFVCAVFSLSLARLCLTFLRYPFYATVVLNWLFYEGPRRMVREMIGARPPCLEAGLALASELGLFMSLADSVATVCKTCCHF
jgi:hypothetical protein